MPMNGRISRRPINAELETKPQLSVAGQFPIYAISGQVEVNRKHKRVYRYRSGETVNFPQAA